MKNKSRKGLQQQKIDVYSSFSESNIEFVSENDEKEVIASLRYSQEKEFIFNHEREYYDTNY